MCFSIISCVLLCVFYCVCFIFTVHAAFVRIKLMMMMIMTSVNHCEHGTVRVGVYRVQ